MQQDDRCPECGSWMPGGFCPACSSAGPHSGVENEPPTPRKPFISFPLIPNIVSVAVFLAASVGFSFYFGGRIAQWREARTERQVTAARKNNPVALRNQLHGSGRIYLVQMGPHTTSYALEDFAQRLRSAYYMDVRVLPPMPLDKSALDRKRKQYIAELLIDQLKRQHSKLASDPHAYLIGFTEAGMYPVNTDWKSTFTWRERRAAVISADGMQDSPWERWGRYRSAANQRYRGRLRRILLKDVAILYWNLPQNRDPYSLLRLSMNPFLPVDHIYQSDLDPAGTVLGRPGDEPCIFFGYSAANGVQPLPGALIRPCRDEPKQARLDESMEVFQVDLRLGLLLDRHTDFYLPDRIPIRFERTTRDGWKDPAGFGITGSHSYNSFLGSTDGMRTIGIYHADGGHEDLKRDPSWMIMLSFAKYVDPTASEKKKQIRWHADAPQHFDLTDYKGDVTSYLPCSAGTPPCYEYGYRNAKGEKLVYHRDAKRQLTSLETPNHSWLRLRYEGPDRIAEIEDSRGRKVEYGYDEGGRLVRVRYPSGEVFFYEYDDEQRLLTFSVARDAHATPVVVLRNQYEHGRITRQTLPGGRTYTYSYSPADSDPIQSARVRTPEGTVYYLHIGESNSIVRRERPRTR